MTADGRKAKRGGRAAELSDFSCSLGGRAIIVRTPHPYGHTLSRRNCEICAALQTLLPVGRSSERRNLI